MAAERLFPSDLADTPRGLRVRVAGRVLVAEPGTCVLSDAFARVGVHGARLGTLEAGELVVVRGVYTGKALRDALVVERFTAPAPRGDGEFARLVLEGVGPRLRARAQALAAIRTYFANEGFIEAETPFAVASPGVDRNVEAVRGGPGWLITSPELEMKRLIVGGIPRQFQIARVAREDELGSLHEPEFTLLEWYRAFSGYESVIRDTERIVVAVTRAVSKRREVVLHDGRTIDLRTPFPRLSVREAFRKYAGVREASDLAANDEDRYFELLVDKIEPALARLPHPVFLVEYPISEAALARPVPKNPAYAERFELYIGGVELANGYGELTDPVEQRRRFEQERRRRRRERRTVYPLNERFLAALEEGMPPSSGNALGVDRLVMLVLGASAIEQVLAFPRKRL